MSDRSGAAKVRFPGDDSTDPLTVEFTVPRDWPAELALTFAELMDKAIKDGFPIVVPVRRDATPEQISRIFEDVRTFIKDAGLAP
jgi:hypothetical protein